MHLMEDNYLKIVAKPQIVVISGCSGGGKSSLINALHKKGFKVIEEVGRQIVKEENFIGGDAQPWENLDKFLRLALSRYIYRFATASKSKKWIFSDRSIIDSIHNQSPEYFKNAALKFRYNSFVFLVPPWKKIFKNDPERLHSFESATNEYNLLKLNYKKYGYKVMVLPKVSLDKRVNFIMKTLRQVDKN